MIPCRPTLLALAVACATLSAASCSSEQQTYTSVRITPTLDMSSVSDDVRREINACGVTVRGIGGAHNDQFTLEGACARNKTPWTLPTFEYSTLSLSGSLELTLTARNLARNPIAVGVTEEIPIVPGMLLTTEVKIVAVAPSGDGGATDGNVD